MRRILPFAFISIFLSFAACSRDAEVIVKNTSDIPEMVLRHSVPVGHANSVLIQDTLSGTNELRFRIAAKQPAFVSLQDVSNPSIIVYFPAQRGETYKLDFDGSTFSFEEPGQDAQRFYIAIPRYGIRKWRLFPIQGTRIPFWFALNLIASEPCRWLPLILF